MVSTPLLLSLECLALKQKYFGYSKVMTMVIGSRLNIKFKSISDEVKVSNFTESKDQDKFSTGTMVTILVIVVTCFFVFFTLMAVCYRFVPFKFDPTNVEWNDVDR